MTVADADTVLAGVPDVRGFQLDQAVAGDLHVRLCLAPHAGSETLGRVERALKQAYDFPVTAEAVSALEHELSGKVRLARRSNV